MACSRTGSSLLGDILTANPNSTYFYEPLFHLHPIQSDPNATLETVTEPEMAEQFIKDLFVCKKVRCNTTFGCQKDQMYNLCTSRRVYQ